MPSERMTLQYSPEEDDCLSNAIVEAVSAAKGRDVSDDDCALYDVVDPDALDDLFRQEHEGEAIKVEFTTHDAIVVLWGNGKITIEVQDLEAGPGSAASQST